MLTVSPGHSAGYLTDQVGAGMEGYYTGAVGAGEPPGRWWGAGAKTLGLDGEVDASTMHALYEDFRDPRDPRFADLQTREDGAVLGRAPKQFRTPEQVVADRIREYSQETGSSPTPEQVQGWRVDAERKASRGVHFLDATFSPPKSVTVAHAAFMRAAHEATERGAVEEAATWQAKVDAIDAAVAAGNDAMLAHLAQHAGYTRVGRHGGPGSAGQWADGHDWTVASFYQHTSRDHDPQLHVHNAILNRVPCADGTWRAVDSRAVHANIQGGGAVASGVMQAELTRSLGFAWVLREDGNDYEVAGIDTEVVDLFSSRSRTLTPKAQALIEQTEAALGYELNSLQRYRLAKEASLSTRAAKTHESETEVERAHRWNAQLQTILAGGLLRQAEQLAAAGDQRLADHAAHIGADHAVGDRFSVDAVISQALEAVHGAEDGAGRSVWGRSELLRRIHLALPPDHGLSGADLTDLMERLTDQALGQAVLVAGREVGDVPCPDRLDNGMSAAAAPYARRYATPGHLAAEVAVLDAMGRRGRHAVPEHAVRAWLDGHATSLNPAQREAVARIASSDAALAVLVGPAGTGKSFTAGTLAAAWADLTTDAASGTTGRVIGLATAENAAQVLTDDGLADAANIAAFLAAQQRLEEGRALPADERWRVGAHDVLAVDEASMLDTRRLTQLQQVADRAGARLLLMGDPAQLAAVGAGGMMRTAIDHGAETYTLTDVRRFDSAWEREASLRLRDGDRAAVLAYDRHGRLRDAGTLEEAIAAVAEAAAADRLAGKQTLVTCATNADAAAVAASVRRHLVEAGLVAEDGILLGRDGTTAGVGDVVQARRIDRGLDLVNRHTYTVVAVREDGGLDVVSTRDGGPRTIPADYVASDLTLGYASTAHAAQGATVDTGHLLLTSRLDRAGAYVGLTRGRDSNTAWAVTVTPTATPTGDPVAADDDAPPRTARGLLDQVVSHDDLSSDLPVPVEAVDVVPTAGRSVVAGPDGVGEQDLSALATAEADDAYRFAPSTLVARIEEQTRIACRQRLEADLDDLVADGTLDADTRARFASEQGTEHLSRQLRALESAGLDPVVVLREAVTSRGYQTADCASRATAARIQKKYGLPVAADDAPVVPARIDPVRADYLAGLAAALDAQRQQLADRVAADAPEWAVRVLGPVPTDADSVEAASWRARAGQIAVVREATGWDDAVIALGRAPGVSTPHKRLEWSRAWVAAGMPAEKRPAADLSDGQLRARIAAGERVLAHAPAAVHEQQRTREQQRADAERAAVLARAQQREDDATRLDTVADHLADVTARLDETNTERARWLIAHAGTLTAADDARAEALRRGIPLGREADRVTAEEWLAAHRAADHADDTRRVITDADVDDRPDDLHGFLVDPAQVDDQTEAGQRVAARHDEPVDLSRPPQASVDVTAVEALAVAAHARRAHDKLADQASDEAAHGWSDSAERDAWDDEWHWLRTRHIDDPSQADGTYGTDDAVAGGLDDGDDHGRS